MFLLKPTIFAIFAILVSVQADQSWYSFRTTFTPTGFPDRQPWLQSEAEDRGWVKVSDDCSEGASFPGFRYAPPGDNPEMVVIYDVNGFIAGMHSIVAKKFISMANNFNFAGSNWYRSDNVLGEDVYLTTAYFVDPSSICQGGRDQAAFDVEGTGNRLWFQNGPTIKDIHVAPLTVAEADANDVWSKHKCLVNMGRHYFQLYHDEDQPCDDLVPIQLMYSGGVMNGFVWQHPAALKGDRYEPIEGKKGTFAVGLLVDRPPKCLINMIETLGVTTMHVYLRNAITMCLSD